jgi:hypothetical protein
MFFSLRHLTLSALAAAALAFPAAAQDAHQHDAPPAQPRTQTGAPGMNMMQMMQQMMSGMMQDHGAMHRMRMMGMDGMDMMAGMQGRMSGIEHVEGHIAFLRAELKISDAQAKLWDEFAAALRANAKQLNELRAELAKAPAAAASPVEQLARREKALAARLEIARRTRPALEALYAALTEDQKKAFARLMSHRRGAR